MGGGVLSCLVVVQMRYGYGGCIEFATQCQKMVSIDLETFSSARCAGIEHSPSIYIYKLPYIFTTLFSSFAYSCLHSLDASIFFPAAPTILASCSHPSPFIPTIILNFSIISLLFQFSASSAGLGSVTLKSNQLYYYYFSILQL